jgi:putative flippase GtrA
MHPGSELLMKTARSGTTGRTTMSCPTLARRRSAQTEVRHAPGPAARADGRWPHRLVSSDSPLAQLTRFALTGGLSSTVQVLLFALLAPVGTHVANVVAWTASTALANELHRRRTFRVGERISWFAAQWEGGSLSLVGLGLTTGALLLLQATTPDAAVPVQVLLVLLVNTTVGGARFLALRWAFFVRPHTA